MDGELPLWGREPVSLWRLLFEPVEGVGEAVVERDLGCPAEGGAGAADVRLGVANVAGTGRVVDDGDGATEEVAEGGDDLVEAGLLAAPDVEDGVGGAGGGGDAGSLQIGADDIGDVDEVAGLFAVSVDAAGLPREGGAAEDGEDAGVG